MPKTLRSNGLQPKQPKPKKSDPKSPKSELWGAGRRGKPKFPENSKTKYLFVLLKIVCGECRGSFPLNPAPPLWYRSRPITPRSRTAELKRLKQAKGALRPELISPHRNPTIETPRRQPRDGGRSRARSARRVSIVGASQGGDEEID